MSKFTDQKPRVATVDDCRARWGGVPNGKRFRCYLCGYKFKPGDTWRWVYGNGQSPAYGNFIVCESCDGEDVLERWAAANKELLQRFWWALDE